MEIVIILESIMLGVLFVYEKGFKAALRGVLFHCAMNGMEISKEKLKELHDLAMRQMLKEFFHKQK